MVWSKYTCFTRVFSFVIPAACVNSPADKVEIGYNKCGHIRYCPKAELFAEHGSEFAFPDTLILIARKHDVHGSQGSGV